MSEISARLALPYLQPAQAQKHVTHNEALARLDVLVQLGVEGFDAQTPPADPPEGAVWGLGPAPTGAWDGQAGALAAFVDGGWLFFAPAAGWRAWDKAQGALFVFTGGAWVNVSGAPDLDNLPGVGVNTASDPINRLAVAAQATLLSHEGAGHQLKVNKAAPGDTASLLFQSDWSGRAEMGLAGNDDFSVKVSADGSAWTEAIRVNPANGMMRGVGLRGRTYTVADDAVLAVVPPRAGGFVFVIITDDAYPQANHSGIFAYDVGASPFLQSLARGPQMEMMGTVTLTGTTGPDGRSSVAAQGGALLIENRFGNPRDFNVTFIGG